MDDKTLQQAIEAMTANSAALIARMDAIEAKLKKPELEKRTAVLDGRMPEDLIPNEWKQYLGVWRPPLGPAKTDEEKLRRAVKTAKFFVAVLTHDREIIKAMAEGTDPAGGYLVPEEFRAEFILKLQILPVLRNVARIWPMGRDRVNIPAEAARITVAWEGENVQWTASDATIGQIALAVNRLDGFTSVSRELLADSAVSVMDILSQMYAEAIGLEEDKQFVIGNGTGKPLGILNTVGIGTVAQAGANLAYSDFVELKYTLGRQYRMGAVWIMADAVLKKAMKLLDSNGRPIFEDSVRAPYAVPGTTPNVAPPQTGTIMNMPVYSQDDVTATKIILGHPKYYFIGDRQQFGAEMTTVGAGAFEKHQAALKVWERVDGKVALTDAWKIMTGVA